MQTTLLKLTKYFITISLFVFILGAKHAEFKEGKAFFHGYPIQKPVIKIGIGVNLSDMKISSSSGMKIYEINSHYRLLAEDIDEVYIKGSKEKLTEKYVIQVAQTKKRKKADNIAKEIGSKIKNRVFVTSHTGNEISGTFLVKVGDFLTRGDALNFMKTLHQIGITDTWILREEITEEESKPLWIFVKSELKSLNGKTDLYFIPSHYRSYLTFNGRDYRGIFVLRSTRKGMYLINVLNIEDYLKGVVPSELSPYTFSELEAHKAQAVAARTYAIGRLGMNKDLGFDFGDTPKTQFYQGMNAEHSLSNKAVDLTKGEVARYRGRLIDALYTSTCGGMTENIENIFGGPSLPYLQSTECTYEKQNEFLLKSRKMMRPIQVNGGDISPDIAGLISLKVISSETNPDYYKQDASFDEAVSWIKNALVFLGKKNENFSPEVTSLNFVTLARLIIDAFKWHNRVENLMLESERDYIMKDFNGLEGESRNYLAYLIQEGIFLSPEAMGDLDEILTRGELAFYLGKVVQNYRHISHQGIFKMLNQDRIELEGGEEKKQFVLSPDLFLLRNNGGNYTFASHVYLLGGDKVRIIENDGQIQLLEVIYPPHTNILDRSSSFHRWKVRVSREALEKRINRYYPIGKLIDIIPQRRGASKRAVEILITGTETRAIVRGLRIRRVLNLKETLFVIDREYDGEGNITHFIFCGRGLGHGVGLCQVGAFGMAQAGAVYKEILKKYYKGIKIKKIY
ncbi:MAG: SpoIID/LytB domain-containing protein [Candidatus Aminicenantes bacterium]|nr:SpoIID/LytB domain-containing protein [Candidatus Aminicenantes bacterium]